MGEKSDADFVASLRHVVDQGASFRDVVLKEAAEQRTALAKEIELSLEPRLADLQASTDEAKVRFQQVEQDVASLHRMCDGGKEVMIRTLVDGVAARCLEIQTHAATLEKRLSSKTDELHSTAEVLEGKVQTLKQEHERDVQRLMGQLQTLEQGPVEVL